MKRATSNAIFAVGGVVLSVASVSPTEAGTIFLGDYLGGSSGSAVTTSNSPYTSVLVPAGSGGFGVDTAGAFAGGALIEFEDAGPFTKGIGAHPDSVSDFNLDPFRDLDRFHQFQAVIGIDPILGGSEGARFLSLC